MGAGAGGKKVIKICSILDDDKNIGGEKEKKLRREIMDAGGEVVCV